MQLQYDSDLSASFSENRMRKILGTKSSERWSFTTTMNLCPLADSNASRDKKHTSRRSQNSMQSTCRKRLHEAILTFTTSMKTLQQFGLGFCRAAARWHPIRNRYQRLFTHDLAQNLIRRRATDRCQQKQKHTQRVEIVGPLVYIPLRCRWLESF